MTLSSVITKLQTRVAADEADLAVATNAATDLKIAEGLLAVPNEIGDMVLGQSAAAAARVAAAEATSTNTGTASTGVRNALSTAFSLSPTKKGKLNKTFTDANYQADFDAVQAAMTTLTTDMVAAADARIDAEASRQKVLARAAILGQWLAVPEGAISATLPLMVQANGSVGGNDLATGWWSTGVVNANLAVVDAAATAKAVTDATDDLQKQADDYGDKLDASLVADALVDTDKQALATAQAKLATTSDTVKAALVALVTAGL